MSGPDPSAFKLLIAHYLLSDKSWRFVMDLFNKDRKSNLHVEVFLRKGTELHSQPMSTHSEKDQSLYAIK
jgi:hypothetical protein